MKLLKNFYVFALVLFLLSCSKKEAEPEGEPDHLVVQHILIAFDGAPRMNVTRSLEEAKILAYDILERAKSGEDFDTLVKEHTDDSHPGIYKLANTDVMADKVNREYKRGGMVKSFGDISFSLTVGEVGITDHDELDSPFGWHIIKRLE